MGERQSCNDGKCITGEEKRPTPETEIAMSSVIRVDSWLPLDGRRIMRRMDIETLANLVTALSIWGAAFLLALWGSLIFWTYRDATARLKDPVRRWLAVLVSVVLFI